MYTITANGSALFTSDNFNLVKAMYKLYKELYAWARVRVLQAACR